MRFWKSVNTLALLVGGLCHETTIAGQPALTQQAVRDLVKAPPEFEVTLFATGTDVGNPFAISAAPTGEVFVAGEEPATAGQPARGRIWRCVDTNDDGRADLVNVFAEVERPRGLIFLDGSAWMQDASTLSVIHDDDRDGLADRQEVLVTGLRSGDDDLPRAMQMGIDGWIYLVIGAQGVREAKGTDGRTVSLSGGGILRVRRDGTELEILAPGIDAPSGIAIDSRLNLFVRGTSLRHVLPAAIAGARLSRRSADVESAADRSRGLTLFCEGKGWPDRFQETVLSSDSLGEITSGVPMRQGATFDFSREPFLKFPDPVAMDLNDSGYLYVASNPGANGLPFVARIAPYSLSAGRAANVREADILNLMKQLTQGGASIRLLAQSELLRRGTDLETSVLLIQAAANKSLPLSGRIAALFTLKQLDGEFSHLVLFRLLADDEMREFALRALTDRRGQIARLDPGALEWALNDQSARVRAQAIIGLTHLKSLRSAWRILPLTSRFSGPGERGPETDRVVPRLAVQTLVSMHAVDECMAALDGPFRSGALRALARMYDDRNVEGLIRRIKTTVPREQRRQLVATLIQLYYRDHEKAEASANRSEWPMSERIANALREVVAEADEGTVEFVRRELGRNRIFIAGLSLPTADAN